MGRNRRIQAVVIGASWGGLNAYTRVLEKIPRELPVPVLLVQHQRNDAGDRMASLLDTRTPLPVISPDSGEEILPGCVYVAPPGYHMLVGVDHCIYFSMSAPVNFSRPAIDELFFSAGHVFGHSLLGVILTGANEDGSAGMCYIRDRGGLTIAQSPRTAEASIMPEAAIRRNCIEYTVDLDDMGDFITELVFGLTE